ncbi:MAG: hypothetical protein WCE68_17085 [Anaerolineales bacterium]
MKTNTLENQEFLLGVEEGWDSYFEVTVKFYKEVTIHGYPYHLFLDEKGEKLYYLRPRYKGHSIEGIYVEKQILVNIAKEDGDVDLNNHQPPPFYTMGILRLPDTPLSK